MMSKKLNSREKSSSSDMYDSRQHFVMLLTLIAASIDHHQHVLRTIMTMMASMASPDEDEEDGDRDVRDGHLCIPPSNPPCHHQESRMASDDMIIA